MRTQALLLVLSACATPSRGVLPGPPSARTSIAVMPESPEGSKEPPPRWSDPAAIKHLWPQGAGLAGARVLCPFAYPKEDSPLRPTTVTYDAGARRKGAFSVHVEYRGDAGVEGSIGVGCLRQYDASRYQYVTFWLKGQPGQRLRFRLRDASDKEAIVERRVQREGWQRVVIPTGDFSGIDLSRLATFGLLFDDGLGPADLHLDHFEFADQ